MQAAAGYGHGRATRARRVLIAPVLRGPVLVRASAFAKDDMR